MRYFTRILIGMLTAAVLLVGCGQASPKTASTPTPGPTVTTSPAPTSPAPTVSASPTPSPGSVWAPTGPPPGGAQGVAPDAAQLAAALDWLRTQVFGSVALKLNTLGYAPSLGAWEVQFAGTFFPTPLGACPPGQTSETAQMPSWQTGFLVIHSATSAISGQADGFNPIGSPGAPITLTGPCPAS